MSENRIYRGLVSFWGQLVFNLTIEIIALLAQWLNYFSDDLLNHIAKEYPLECEIYEDFFEQYIESGIHFDISLWDEYLDHLEIVLFLSLHWMAYLPPPILNHFLNSELYKICFAISEALNYRLTEDEPLGNSFYSPIVATPPIF